MKIRTIFISILLFATLLFSGCEKTTEGLTRITYYPSLTLEGGSFLHLDKGTEFTDPGYSAILNEEDVTDQVVVTTDLDMSTSGYYTINYSIVNADGFLSSATRNVLVTDPNDPIEGIYYSSPDSYRDFSGQTPYGGSYPILVYSAGDGYYFVEDLLGGWYYQRAGYGSMYAMQGIVAIDTAAGTLSLESSYIEGWGDSLVSLTQGTYSNDGNTVTLTWRAEYVQSLVFYVTLEK